MLAILPIAAAGLCLLLAFSHHGLAALAVGGGLVALLVAARLIDGAISADHIPSRRRPRRRW